MEFRCHLARESEKTQPITNHQIRTRDNRLSHYDNEGTADGFSSVNGVQLLWCVTICHQSNNVGLSATITTTKARFLF